MSQKKKNNKRKTIVVLGAARSGTSMLGGILSILGVNMGKNLLEADEFNPKGYFEDKDFINLSDDIFESAGTNYWNFPSLNKILSQKEKFKNRIQKLIDKKSKTKQVWGWKDPWTNLIIELLLPYLINPYFIIILRNPIEVAESSVEFTKAKEGELWVKKRVSFFQALKLAIFYDKIILDFLEKHPDLPKLFVSYEILLNNPPKEVREIANFLRLHLAKEKIEKINKFIIKKT